jgi:hypothetical protein
MERFGCQAVDLPHLGGEDNGLHTGMIGRLVNWVNELKLGVSKNNKGGRSRLTTCLPPRQPSVFSRMLCKKIQWGWPSRKNRKYFFQAICAAKRPN